MSTLTDTLTANDLVLAITKGARDGNLTRGDLESISNAVRDARRAMIATATAEVKATGTLRVNGQARLKGTVKPIRLRGQIVTITKVNATRCRVKLVVPDERFSGEFHCPIAMLDPID